ncbi:hypothetical protein KCP69_04755 [Salmonella enterica subsp. enterica]|nr:hypothetical protein KCP69_04755 [Salmonella enterica subsp. enterica]
MPENDSIVFRVHITNKLVDLYIERFCSLAICDNFLRIYSVVSDIPAHYADDVRCNRLNATARFITAAGCPVSR